jgi:hypothetical protein
MSYFLRLLTVACATILAAFFFYSFMVLGTGFRHSDHSHAKSVWFLLTIISGLGFLISLVARWMIGRRAH